LKHVEKVSLRRSAGESHLAWYSELVGPGLLIEIAPDIEKNQSADGPENADIPDYDHFDPGGPVFSDSVQ